MLLPLQGVAFSANRKKIITDRKEREQLAVFGASCSLFCGLDRPIYLIS